MFSSSHYAVARRISKILQNKGLRLGTAESCTGGLLAALCTELPGSSAWFDGGIVSYANTVKETLLRVPYASLMEKGAVSREVAISMAEGCLSALGVSCAISTTGIAGPDGGTSEKPVGTVWIAAAVVRDSSYLVVPEQFLFNGNRSLIRLTAVEEALLLLERVLCSSENITV